MELSGRGSRVSTSSHPHLASVTLVPGYFVYLF